MNTEKIKMATWNFLLGIFIALVVVKVMDVGQKMRGTSREQQRVASEYAPAPLAVAKPEPWPTPEPEPEPLREMPPGWSVQYSSAGRVRAVNPAGDVSLWEHENVGDLVDYMWDSVEQTARAASESWSAPTTDIDEIAFTEPWQRLLYEAKRDGTVTNVIRSLLTHGNICDVINHIWVEIAVEPGIHPPGTVGYRKCALCLKDERLAVSVWE